MTAANFREKLGTIRGLVSDWGFAFPYVQLHVSHPDFSDKDGHECETLLAEWLEIPLAELRQVIKNGLISISYFSLTEAKPPIQRGHHWLEGPVIKPLVTGESSLPVVVHFFGYKGGQARSTMMALLARQLIENGRKVLLVDADLEAPSLPEILGIRPRSAASTLLGLHLDPVLEPVGVPCLSPSKDPKAMATFIAARLQTDVLDWEYDAFTLNALMDPAVPSALGARILRFAKTEGYDAILVDQRSGASPATLNWMASLPGNYCVFARLDEQWRGGGRFFTTLAQMAPSSAGAVVSFQPDTENLDTYRSRNAAQIEDLNQLFLEARLSLLPQTEADLIDPTDRWVLWPYHPAFRSARCPSLTDLAPEGREALLKLRDLLELPAPRPTAEPVRTKPVIVASLSGSNEQQADLIQTHALSLLREPNNSFTYIFGRKGTGKSRLFLALVQERICEPFIADENFKEVSVGFRSNDLRELSEGFSGSAEDFWWRLFAAYLSESNKAADNLRRCFSVPFTSSGVERVRTILTLLQDRVVLAIDGLETAFLPAQIYRYMEGLFTVMRIIQTDPVLNDRLDVRLFLRTDLSRRNTQNLEQQISGRVVYLMWDFQRILNFLLSRATKCAFLREHFAEVILAIEARGETIRSGEIGEDEAMNLLLKIFPERLPRMSILMRTFLKLHFADSASGEERYYPRFVQQFLDALSAPDVPTMTDSRFSGSPIFEGRVSPELVYFAHDEASKKFLVQVRQELSFVLELDPADRTRNEDCIEKLLGAFSGEQTPFLVDATCARLSQRLSYGTDLVRDAMERMKTLGVFEDRPGYEGLEWRAGRLFKAALRMKLRR